MKNPQRDGESLEDYGKRLLLEALRRKESVPKHKPKPKFIWPESLDEQPAELTGLLRTMLNANNREKGKELVTAWFRQATRGNRTALREMLDRMEGTVHTSEEKE